MTSLTLRPVSVKAGRDVADLGTSQGDEERRAFDPLHEVLEKVEEQRLGPLDVVDDDHCRPVVDGQLHQTAGRPQRLLGRPRLGGPDEAGKEGDEPFRIADLADERAEMDRDVVGTQTSGQGR